jgi:hypothetical protein
MLVDMKKKHLLEKYEYICFNNTISKNNIIIGQTFSLFFNILKRNIFDRIRLFNSYRLQSSLLNSI